MSTRTSHVLVFIGVAFVLLVLPSVAGRGLKDITGAHVTAETRLLGTPLALL